MPNISYRLGKGTLTTAQDVLKELVGNVGRVGPYLDEESSNSVVIALNELLIYRNIEYLKKREGVPGSIMVDFFAAYLKSRNKLVVSDRELEQASEEELL